MAAFDLEIALEFKRNLASAEDFASVMNFFFEKLLNRGFVERCRPLEPPESLSSAVARAAASARGHAAQLSDWRLMEVPEARIIHGVLGVDGLLATIVWAADIQTGMLAIAQGPGSSEVLFSRLSIVPAQAAGTAN
jgi:hypothetical protein